MEHGVHSSNIVKFLVAQKEEEAVENATHNTTLCCWKVMADLSNNLQTKAATAMSSIRTWNKRYIKQGLIYFTKQDIYWTQNKITNRCMHLFRRKTQVRKLWLRPILTYLISQPYTKPWILEKNFFCPLMRWMAVLPISFCLTLVAASWHTVSNGAWTVLLRL